MDNQIVIDELLSSLNPDTETIEPQEETPVSVAVDVQENQFVYPAVEDVVIGTSDPLPDAEIQHTADVAQAALDSTGLGVWFHFEDSMLQFNDQADGLTNYLAAGSPFGYTAYFDTLSVLNLANSGHI